MPPWVEMQNKCYNYYSKYLAYLVFPYELDDTYWPGKMQKIHIYELITIIYNCYLFSIIFIY